VPRLVLRRDDGTEEAFALDRDVVTIGRDEPEEGVANDIALNDRTVSRRHVRLVRTDGGYLIEDLGSANRTFVNNRPVRKARLRHGDVITIGLNLLVYQDEGAPAPSSRLELELPAAGGVTLNLEHVVLQRLAEKAAAATEPEDFLRGAVEALRRLIPAEKGLLLLGSLEEGLRCAASWGEDAAYSRSLVEATLREGKALVTGPGLDPSRSALGRGALSLMCAPVMKGGEPAGALYLEDPRPARFTQGDLVLLSIAASQVAAGMERIALNRKIREEALVRAALERFFSPALVTRILSETREAGGLSLVPERAEATVLFLDIAGFTRLAERLSPLEIAGLLGEYFELLVEEVFAHGGVLDKYLGDGLMALFGVPERCRDHAARAVRAALGMKERHFSFVARLPEEKRFAIRIGMESGEVVAGYLGSRRRLEYTALGRTVVAARRLESLAPPNRIYAGRGACAGLGPGFEVVPVGRVRMPKGEEELEVYEVRGEREARG